MKKGLLVLLIIVLALSMTACMPGMSTGGVAATELILPTEAEVSEGETKPTELEVMDPAKYTADLKGLEGYLKDSYIIAGEPLEMSEEAIGAKAGDKFVVNYQKEQTQIELYEFDLNNLNERAQNALNSVKAYGKFAMLDQVITAYLSDSGKYLMIYSVNESNDAVKKQKERAIEVFKVF